MRPICRHLVFTLALALTAHPLAVSQPAPSANSEDLTKLALPFLQNRADSGDAAAESELGDRYDAARGIAKDLQSARYWYQKAAAQGNKHAKSQLARMGPAPIPPQEVGPTQPPQPAEDLTKLALPFVQNRADSGDAASQSELGDRYAGGRGVPRDYVQAAVWYRKAADQGIADAQNHLGDLYYYGHGVSRDYAQAVAWYRKAADQGFPAGEFNLGYVYVHGQGVAQDYAQAVSWYRKAADQGDALAQVNLGVLYANGQGVPQDYAQAADWYRKAAGQGSASAQNNLGDLYYYSRGVQRDYVQSAAWYRKAAEQGLVLGEVNLGYMYVHGEGVGQDYAQAFNWYRKAADQGDASAEVNLGVLFANGQGVSQDYLQAADWYRKAANQGSAPAQDNLGDLYYYGHGLAKDYAQALAWYQKSADQGDALGQYDLGYVYAHGNGVEQNLSLARQWLQKAAGQGNQPAKEELAKLDIPAPAAPIPARGFEPETPARPPNVAATIPIPHNYALIFATDDYAHWPHLTNPIPDADAVNQTLASLYGFQVDEVRNATTEQILLKLNDYLHRKFEPQDQLLIFFSGHGYFDNDLGQGFVVPADAPLVADDPVHRNLLAYDEIMRYVNRIPATHIVLIADACFAGTLDRRIADGALRGDPSDVYAHATLPELLARKEPKRTRRYFASGGKDFVPDGLPGHHSPFVSALLVTLNQAADRKGYLTLDDIQQGLNTVTPEPRWGDIQDENEPGADFLLLTPAAIAKLTQPN